MFRLVIEKEIEDIRFGGQQKPDKYQTGHPQCNEACPLAKGHLFRLYDLSHANLLHVLIGRGKIF